MNLASELKNMEASATATIMTAITKHRGRPGIGQVSNFCKELNGESDRYAKKFDTTAAANPAFADVIADSRARVLEKFEAAIRRATDAGTVEFA